MGLQHSAAEWVRAVTEQVFQPSTAAALESEQHKDIRECETVFSLPGNPEPKLSLCDAKCHTSTGALFDLHHGQCIKQFLLGAGGASAPAQHSLWVKIS